jgi:hypothetical protein
VQQQVQQRRGGPVLGQGEERQVGGGGQPGEDDAGGDVVPAVRLVEGVEAGEAAAVLGG